MQIVNNKEPIKTEYPPDFPALYVVLNHTPDGVMYNRIEDTDIAGECSLSNSFSNDEGSHFTDIDIAKKVCDESHSQIIEKDSGIITEVRELKYNEDGKVLGKTVYARASESNSNAARAVVEDAEFVPVGVWGDPKKESSDKVRERFLANKEESTRQQRRQIERAAEKLAEKEFKKIKERQGKMSPTARMVDILGEHLGAITSVCQNAFNICLEVQKIIDKQGLGAHITKNAIAEGHGDKIADGAKEIEAGTRAVCEKMKPAVLELLGMITELFQARNEVYTGENKLAEKAKAIYEKMEELEDLVKEYKSVCIEHGQLEQMEKWEKEDPESFKLAAEKLSSNL